MCSDNGANAGFALLVNEAHLLLNLTGFYLPVDSSA
jgi:hypothetical protein